MLNQESRELCRLFADMLDYPEKGLAQAARNCAARLEKVSPGIAAPAVEFADFVDSQSLESLEELYTQTFDITPASSLYLGYHLFGETPKRSEFLVQLTEAYQAHALSPGTELADHLGVLLRFLSVSEDPEFTAPLLEECILPTLARTEKELEKTGNQYALIMGPLLKFLHQLNKQMPRAGGVANA